MSSPKDIIICLHIEKTAGSTFKEILRSVYKERFIELFYTHTVESAWNIVNRTPLNDIKVIYGHMPYGIHRYFPQEVGYKYITILRNPVERLMSLWHFERIVGCNRPPFDKGSAPEFLEWAGNQVTSSRDNEMVRVISGNDESFTKERKYFVTSKDYEIALENLLSFYYVCTAETLSTDILKLSTMLKWKSIPKQDNVYSFPERLKSKDLPETDLHKIEGMQYYDLCLWNKIFEEK
jgi:hypothetical protein